MIQDVTPRSKPRELVTQDPAYAGRLILFETTVWMRFPDLQAPYR